MCEGVSVKTVARDAKCHIIHLKFESQSHVLKYLSESKGS
jgi:hypothetical protein